MNVVRYLSNNVKYGERCEFDSTESFCDAVVDCGFPRPILRPGSVNGEDVWLDEEGEVALIERTSRE